MKNKSRNKYRKSPHMMRIDGFFISDDQNKSNNLSSENGMERDDVVITLFQKGIIL